MEKIERRVFIKADPRKEFPIIRSVK